MFRMDEYVYKDEYAQKALYALPLFLLMVSKRWERTESCLNLYLSRAFAQQLSRWHLVLEGNEQLTVQ